MQRPETLTFTMADGLQVVGTAFGEKAHLAILLLHGAGQTRHSWDSTAKSLATQGFRAIAVDTRGHGESGWSSGGDYDIDTLISDLKIIVKCVGVQGSLPIVIGASLGGITALLAAGETPDPLFSALVLVDITPRVDPEGVARILQFMNGYSGGFESLEQAAKAIAAYQPHRRQARSGDLGGLLKNLRLKADGRYYWHWDPLLLEHVSHFGEEIINRQKAAAKSLALPVLLVHGKLSEIVNRETADEFLQIVPHAKYVDVADAAHMVASEDNEVFAAAVLEFLIKSH